MLFQKVTFTLLPFPSELAAVDTAAQKLLHFFNENDLRLPGTMCDSTKPL